MGANLDSDHADQWPPALSSSPVLSYEKEVALKISCLIFWRDWIITTITVPNKYPPGLRPCYCRCEHDQWLSEPKNDTALFLQLHLWPPGSKATAVAHHSIVSMVYASWLEACWKKWRTHLQTDRQPPTCQLDVYISAKLWYFHLWCGGVSSIV